MARSSRKTPQHRHGFVRVTHVRCPSCEDRGALKNEGRPVVVSGGQLRGASRSTGLSTLASHCETCAKTGAIPVDPMSPESIDPYARKR